MSELFPYIDGYKLIRQLGEGGMGTVYFGLREKDERPVAIKLIRADILAGEEATDFIARFRREMKLCAAFAHPYVTTTIDGGQTAEGHLYLVMEHVEGEALDSVLSDEPLTEAQGLQIAKQMGEALSYIHSQGICHRDIKPANIILASSQRSVLVDFGLALESNLTRLTGTGDFVGTFFFMAPERIKGKDATFAADIYSLGVTLYYCLSLRLPYHEDSLNALLHRMEAGSHKELSELNKEISPAFSRLVQKCVAFAPHDRFHSAEEFLQALTELSEPVAKEVAEVKELTKPPKAKSSSLRSVFVACCMLLSIVIALGIVRGTTNTGKSTNEKLFQSRRRLLSQKRLPTEKELIEMGQLLLANRAYTPVSGLAPAAWAHYDLVKRAKDKRQVELFLAFIKSWAIDWYSFGQVIPNELLQVLMRDSSAHSRVFSILVKMIEKAKNQKEKLVLLPLLNEYLCLLEKGSVYPNGWQAIETEARKAVNILLPMVRNLDEEKQSTVLQSLFRLLYFIYDEKSRQIVADLAARAKDSAFLSLLAAKAIARVRPQSTSLSLEYNRIAETFLKRGLLASSPTVRMESLVRLAKHMRHQDKSAEALQYFRKHDLPKDVSPRLKCKIYYQKALLLVSLAETEEALVACKKGLQYSQDESQREALQSQIRGLKTLKLINPGK